MWFIPVMIDPKAFNDWWLGVDEKPLFIGTIVDYAPGAGTVRLVLNGGK